jgi:hypothetical protein
MKERIDRGLAVRIFIVQVKDLVTVKPNFTVFL